VQRTAAVMLLVMLPMSGLFLNMEHALYGMAQDPEVCKLDPRPAWRVGHRLS
jgi:hypothetical protein